MLRLLRLQIALTEYRGRHARYPHRLTGLVPGALPAVPLDPFSERPFVYRRHGEGYLLYSVGPDGRDDGGRAVPSGSLKRSSRGDLVAGRLFALTASGR